jgi:uncharacterized protein involved in type VI secretion and phage assembly
VHRQAAADGYTTAFSISGLHPSSLLHLLAPESEPAISSNLVIGIVTDNQDPENLGRVKVKYPWLSADHSSDWARVIAVGGGKERGVQFLPEINDEVLVGFEQGDINSPYVLGGLWNGQDAPVAPASAIVKGGQVQRRIIRSRSGHEIVLDDSNSDASIIITDKAGNQITLDSQGRAITITSTGDLKLKASGNMALEAQGRVSLKASGGVEIDGQGGTVDVKGSLINLN